MNKVKTLLWLDDYRNPNEDEWLVFSPIHPPYEVSWVKSYDEFISYISANGLPDGICFDHDLADERQDEKTGMDCARWLVWYCIDNNKPLPKWNSQSANPVGRQNINNLLNNFRIFQLND